MYFRVFIRPFSSVLAVVPLLTNFFSALRSAFATVIFVVSSVFLPWDAPVVSSPRPSLPMAAASSVYSVLALSSAAASIPPCDLVIALLHERLVRQNAKFAELVEDFLSRKDRVLQLKSFLATTDSSETKLRTQVSVDTIGRPAACADLMASVLFGATATSELDKLFAENRGLRSQLLEVTYTTDSSQLQLSDLKTSFSMAALDFFCYKRERSMDLLRFLVRKICRLDSDYIILFA